MGVSPVTSPLVCRLDLREILFDVRSWDRVTVDNGADMNGGIGQRGDVNGCRLPDWRGTRCRISLWKLSDQHVNGACKPEPIWSVERRRMDAF